MRLKGISYDVGRVLVMNWHPVFDSAVAQETYGDFSVPFYGRSRG
jgi:hypothetical protein